MHLLVIEILHEIQLKCATIILSKFRLDDSVNHSILSIDEFDCFLTETYNKEIYTRDS